MRVVYLVPWRGGDELREQSWDVIRPRLEHWPVFTGDSKGTWSRGAAINAAAREAGNWDVAIIADADTVPPVDLGPAIALAADTGGGVRPHDHLYRLTPSGSIAMARGDAIEPRHIEREFPGGGYLVVAREGWDRVSGYSEAYVGWGHEDSALNISLLLKADWDRLPGKVYHLWHPEPSRSTRDYRRNVQLLQRLRRDNTMALRAAAVRKGYDVGAIL